MADIFLRQNYFRLLRVTHLSERNISMCILLRCADRFNFVMRNRVYLCKNSLDFKLLLEIGNSEYDIGIDDKMFAGRKLSLDSESAWRQLQRPTTPRQPFIIFFPLQHPRRCHHCYCHHLRHHIEVTAFLFVDSAPHPKSFVCA